MRFGLIGTGHWAASVHAPGLASHPNVEFVGVWGRDPERASELARRHDVGAFVAVDELLASVEAVSFAVAPDIQASVALLAAAKGVHLLLEKPLALTAEAAERLSVEAASVHSVVFFTGRFASPTRHWFEEVLAGAWAGASFRWIVPTARPGTPYAASPWRITHGALWDVGPHALSFLLPVLGPVQRVAAVRGAAGSVALALRHEPGATSTITLDIGAPVRETELVFWGPEGVARAPARGPQDTAAAYAAAVDALIVGDKTCDAAFGASIVQTLAAAERTLA